MNTATKLAGVLVFVVLATANSGGYRYGVSDQAFYLPAVNHHLTPELFPRDAPLLDAQARLITSDELMAAAVKTTGLSLPMVAAILYVLTLVLLIASAAGFTRGLGYSWWAVTLFGILLTFRHRIAKTGANSLEGYMHPREMAFAIGIASLACLVRGRHALALGLVAASAVLHPTTAAFFGLVVGVAALDRYVARPGSYVARPRPNVARPAPQGRETTRALGLIAAAAVLLAAVALWALVYGPLSGRLGTMDAEWLQVFAEKDYLFPAQWPIDAWLINLAYPVIIFAMWRARVRRDLAGPNERGLVIGLMASVVFFLVSVPFTMAEVALAVQLQITRVFWILDFVAIASIAWWLTQSRRVAMVAIGVCLVGSAARGYYLLEVDQPDRQLVRLNLPDTPWMDAMRWLETQPSHWHVLADPGHAWKYGISVRVGANRDTLIESVKDSAIAIYDRTIAMRVADRVFFTNDYDQMSTARVRMLDEKYDLDVAVVTAGSALDLPLLYRNAEFAIYDVR
ncbi:MAG TPA: hypothetical protein PKW63_02065 [Vicinamibacterales bacterium]|nr:hypothetical protein [Acidobacteriota bacterium]HQX80508.1 hypothetical protein [Vicinamibacterales bacterium]